MSLRSYYDATNMLTDRGTSRLSFLSEIFSIIESEWTFLIPLTHELHHHMAYCPPVWFFSYVVPSGPANSAPCWRQVDQQKRDTSLTSQPQLMVTKLLIEYGYGDSYPTLQRLFLLLHYGYDSSSHRHACRGREEQCGMWVRDTDT